MLSTLINRLKNLRAESQFAIVLVMIFLLTTIIVARIESNQLHDHAQTYIREKLTNSANLVTGIVETVRAYTVMLLGTATAMPEVSDALGSGGYESVLIMQQRLSDYLTGINLLWTDEPVYVNILVFDNNLNLVASADPYGESIEALGELFPSEYLFVLEQGESVYAIYTSEDARLLVVVTMPVFRDGYFYGMTALLAYIEAFGFFLQGPAEQEHGFVLVADSWGTVLFSGKPEYVGRTLYSLGIMDSFGRINVGNFHSRTSRITGTRYYSLISVEPRMGWSIIGFYEQDAIGGFFISIATSIAPMIVSMVFIIILVVTFINRIYKPLKPLAVTAMDVAGGNLDASFDIHGEDEIARVSRSFMEIVNTLNVLRSNFKKVEHAMTRGDIGYRIRDSRLDGVYDEMLSITNGIIEEFQNFFELLTEPIVIIDRDLRIRFINKVMREYTDADNKKFYGMRINDFFGGDIAGYLGKFTMTGEAIEGEEIQLTLHGGRVFDMELSSAPFFVDGRVEGALLVFSDVTHVKLIQRQKIEAESASRAQSDFLSKMSHEIRTPMNAIMGITDIELLKGGHHPDTEKALMQIHSSSAVLLSIINDILDLSKVEAGEMEIITKPYDIASLIYDTVQVNLMHVDDKNISFNLEIEDGMPANFIGDELRIRQVLNNLLSNAFKYTKEGSVTARFRAEKSDESFNLYLGVEDTGQGMSREQLDSLFSGDYVRYDAANNKLIEGTGLGLNITNRLIQIMDGEIIAESEPGRGSSFSVRLPQGIHDELTLDTMTIKNLRNFQVSQRSFLKRHNFDYEHMSYGRVLFVDDVESNLFVAKGLLMPYGLNIETASSGYAALELINEGNVYDIIFMDHMMPGMDGMETAAAIFKTGYDEPIVALTANTIRGQEEEFLSNGFAAFLPKPIDVSDLNSVLVRFIRDKYPAHIVEAAQKSAPLNVDVSSEVLASFLRDAERAAIVLETLVEKPDWESDDFKNYTINIHGMKSALANIGRDRLSHTASALEQAGRDGNTDFIQGETPAFLADLREVVARLSPEHDADDDAEDDIAVLWEGLAAIREASDAYNKKAARDALKSLNEQTWSKSTKALLDNIAAHLLHSEFEAIVETVDGTGILGG